MKRISISILLGAATVAGLFSCPATWAAETPAPASEAQTLYDQALQLYQGRGVAMDLDKAEALFGQAHALAQAGQSLQEQCAIWVYGLGVKPDAQRADECAERTQDRLVLARLYANGEYVQQDLAKARALVQAARKDKAYEDFESDAFDELESDVAAKAKSHSIAKVDLNLACADTKSTPQDALCRASQDRIEEGQAKRHMQAIAVKLDGSARKAFAAYVDAMVTFYGANMQYNAAAFMGGSGAQLEVFGWKNTVGRDLNAFESYKAASAKPEDLAKADAELNAAYKEAMQVKEWVEGAIPPEARDRVKLTLRTAQRAWIKYRDARVALFKTVYGPTLGASQVELDSMLAATRARTQELQR